MSKHQKVKVKNFSGGTGEKIIEDLDALVADKPDYLMVHAGTNDITNGINSINCAKKKKKKKLLKKLNIVKLLKKTNIVKYKGSFFGFNYK